MTHGFSTKCNCEKVTVSASSEGKNITVWLTDSSQVDGTGGVDE